MGSDLIRPVDIEATEAVIRPYIRQTPTIETHSTDFGFGDYPITLKLELFQHGGSFKARGAFANLLTREVPEAGVVAASGGNHGVAVAFSAMKLNIPAKIFVPSVASPSKVSQITACGAELVIAGDRYADALAASEAWIETSGAMPVPAFDQRETLLGQGTAGLEFERQAPHVDTVFVSVGGGGFIGGIAAWYAGGTKVIGVEPVGAPTLHDALAAGEPVDAPTEGVAADSLAPRRVGQLMFPIAQRFINQVILVSDADIQNAQELLWRTVRVVAEPGGAAAFAALASGYYQPQDGERVGVVICGGNTVAVDFNRQLAVDNDTKGVAL